MEELINIIVETFEIKEKPDSVLIEKISTGFKWDDVIHQVIVDLNLVGLIYKSIGKLESNPTPLVIIIIIKKIFDQVKALRGVQISTSDLIDTVAFLIKLIFITIPQTREMSDLINETVDSSVELIKLIVPENKISFSFCCCQST